MSAGGFGFNLVGPAPLPDGHNVTCLVPPARSRMHGGAPVHSYQIRKFRPNREFILIVCTFDALWQRLKMNSGGKCD